MGAIRFGAVMRAFALARFDRPASIIGESPDDASNQAIRAVLVGRHD